MRIYEINLLLLTYFSHHLECVNGNHLLATECCLPHVFCMHEHIFEMSVCKLNYLNRVCGLHHKTWIFFFSSAVAAAAIARLDHFKMCTTILVSGTFFSSRALAVCNIAFTSSSTLVKRTFVASPLTIVHTSMQSTGFIFNSVFRRHVLMCIGGAIFIASYIHYRPQLFRTSLSFSHTHMLVCSVRAQFARQKK